MSFNICRAAGSAPWRCSSAKIVDSIPHPDAEKLKKEARNNELQTRPATAVAGIHPRSIHIGEVLAVGVLHDERFLTLFD